MRQHMMQALNLTDAQKQQAKTIFQDARQKAQPLRDQLKQNREALTAAVKADDVARIHSLTAERGKLEGQMLGIRTEAMAKRNRTVVTSPSSRLPLEPWTAERRGRRLQRRTKPTRNAPCRCWRTR